VKLRLKMVIYEEKIKRKEKNKLSDLRGRR